MTGRGARGSGGAGVGVELCRACKVTVKPYFLSAAWRSSRGVANGEDERREKKPGQVYDGWRWKRGLD